MKAVAAVLGPLASIATIISVIVRLKWARAKHAHRPDVPPPSPGVRKAALIWLWAFTLFVALITVILILPAFLRLFT